MSWISKNNYLTESEMQNNALLVKSYLVSKGWSINAIAGMLGNMESESNINPGLWQSLDYGNMSGGYGLVQWTPATNFTNWADANGYAWDDGNAQLKWIDEETVNTGQWISTSLYPFSFETFKTSSEPPAYLASAFLKNFERAGIEVEDARRENARKWYEYITGHDAPDEPSEPSEPSTPSKTKKHKYNFLLMNASRRRKQWTNRN